MRKLKMLMFGNNCGQQEEVVIPFTPSDVSGMRGWWKADAITAADLDVLAAWNDSGSLARNMSERAAGKGGVYRTNQLNGKPGVTFNGTDQGMKTAKVDWAGSSASYTIYAVIKSSAVQSAYANAFGADYSNGATPAWPAYEQSTGDTANGPYWAAWDSDNDSYGGSLDIKSTPTSNTSVLITLKKNALVSQSAELNGTEVDTGAVTNPMSLGNTTFGMGHVPTFGRYWSGTIFEIIAYNEAVSAPNDTSIKAYLATKYGLTIA